jgi:CBS domain-containing membrane protein
VGASSFNTVNMNPRPKLVRDLMTSDLVTLDHNEKLVVADDVMRLGRIRHLPIIDENGTLVGIVSQRDLFHSGLMKALGYGSHAQHNMLDLLAVKEAMKTDVVTTTPNTPLVDAAKLMLERKIGCLMVMDGKKIAGILTEGDFVKLVAEG